MGLFTYLRSKFRNRPSDFEIADTASAMFLNFMIEPSDAYRIDFRSLPISKEVQPALGFIAAGSDVVAHTLGGAPAGPASINAALRVYQGLFDEQYVEGLMESTFALYRSLPPEFETGRKLGIDFAIANIRNEPQPETALYKLFDQYYYAYRKEPSSERP